MRASKCSAPCVLKCVWATSSGKGMDMDMDTVMGIAYGGRMAYDASWWYMDGHVRM